MCHSFLLVSEGWVLSCWLQVFAAAALRCWLLLVFRVVVVVVVVAVVAVVAVVVVDHVRRFGAGMGVDASSLSGRAAVPVALQSFQSKSPEEVQQLLRRYRNKVDTFAVDQAAFAAVLGAGEAPVRLCACVRACSCASIAALRFSSASLAAAPSLLHG